MGHCFFCCICYGIGWYNVAWATFSAVKMAALIGTSAGGHIGIGKFCCSCSCPSLNLRLGISENVSD